MSDVLPKRIAIFAVIFLLAVSVRFLTMQFMKAHLDEASWFQFGSYQVFEKRAKAILAGRESLFLIDDPSRTDVVQFPPAFPWWIALIYRLSGDHSAYSVQRVQWVIDLLLSMLLISGIAATAYGWRAATGASLLTALSPLLAMYGAWPTADPPTTWFVLGSTWLLLVGIKRQGMWWVLSGGLVLGIACWLRVNPLFLAPWWAIALVLFLRTGFKRRVALASGLVGATALVISPIVLRNYSVYPDFTPTGGTFGATVWQGLGETELGRKHGFIFGDVAMVELDRQKLGLPVDFPIELFWPDGIRRDKERTREAFAFIQQHPFWYSGVMLHRMWGMIKVAGKPSPYSGSAGINVTDEKCLSPQRRGGIVAVLVNMLGMIQSTARYLLLPLAVIGIWLGLRRDWPVTALLLTTILYYLVPGTTAHTEIRYTLPMHGVLIVFAGLALAEMADKLRQRIPLLKTRVNQKR